MAHRDHEAERIVLPDFLNGTGHNSLYLGALLTGNVHAAVGSPLIQGFGIDETIHGKFPDHLALNGSSGLGGGGYSLSGRL